MPGRPAPAAEPQAPVFVDTVDQDRWDARDGGDDDRLPLWAQLGPKAESFDRVIQRRKYALGHELAAMVGGLPVDPLYKGLLLNAGYTFHFNHYLAWEVLQGSLMFNFSTSLARQLIYVSPNSGGSPTGPIANLLGSRSQVDWFLASRLVVKPFYGKEAVLSAGLVHMEVFVAVGPAYVRTEGALSQGARLLGYRDQAPKNGFGLDVALGLRLWLAKHLSIRGELGELVYFQPGIKQALHASGGLALTFGGES